MTYTLLEHARMYADAPRMSAYASALRRVVTADSVVLDIGTGLGGFALLAARLGARRVYAVEPDPIIEVARALAEANGLEDRITFVQRASSDVTLPERADVMVSDLRGVLPYHGRHLPAVIDARERLLRPGGRLLPLRDVLSAALVDDAAVHAERVQPWRTTDHGLDLDTVRGMLSHVWTRARIEPSALLTPAVALVSIDYGEVASPDLDVTVTLAPVRDGVTHGVAVWFDTTIAEGDHLSNAPGAPRTVYGQAFFPFRDAMRVEGGRPVVVHLRARLAGGEYVWHWTASGPRWSVEHCSLHALPLGPALLRRRQAAFVPELSDEGELARAVLDGLAARRPLGAIAADVRARLPERFASESSALDAVADIAGRFGR